EGQRHFLETLREIGRRRPACAFSRLQTLTLLSDTLEVARRSLERDAARKEVVAGEARGNLYEIPRLPEVLDRLAENDFHGSSRTLWGRARSAAPVEPRVPQPDAQRADADERPEKYCRAHQQRGDETTRGQKPCQHPEA